MNEFYVGDNSLPNFEYYEVSTTNNLLNLVNGPYRKRVIKTLTISGCNDDMSLLVLSDFDNLQKLTIKSNSLQKVETLKLFNNVRLKTIIVSDGYTDWKWDNYYNNKYCTYSYGAFRETKTVIIESTS